MVHLQHLPAVLGTCLVIVACTGSTDEAEPDGTPPDEYEVGLSEEQLRDDGLGDANVEAEAETDAKALPGEGIDAEVSEGQDFASDDAYHRRCDRRKDWSCRSGHRGWRWVRIPRDGWYSRCCVRVRHPHHW